MAAFIAWLKQIWNAVKSNPVFVVASTAFVGAIVSMIQDEMASGKVDWTRSGLNKLMGYAFGMAVAAVVHLYRPAPNPTVPASFPPNPQVVQVPAQLEPISPKAVPVNPLQK